MREEQELILEELAEQWLSNNAKKLYIYIRYKIALEVKKDMEERPKYKITGKGWENQRLVEMGKFLPTDYQTLGDSLYFAYWGHKYRKNFSCSGKLEIGKIRLLLSTAPASCSGSL